MNLRVLLSGMCCGRDAPSSVGGQKQKQSKNVHLLIHKSGITHHTHAALQDARNLTVRTDLSINQNNKDSYTILWKQRQNSAAPLRYQLQCKNGAIHTGPADIHSYSLNLKPLFLKHGIIRLSTTHLQTYKPIKRHLATALRLVLEECSPF